ncbi:hypothetical protein GWK47_010457 [Chionoecetes opilio]|uniref:Uncharacterized protein n=1 Tax=Chionoecetes opilio TaxID=41210 RepID=A0A8J4XW97_CHIOP|nr:hypothetical protein GWK47_010457 [Chionoecetes opilio]
MKARSWGSPENLQNGWKNVKDWYVKLSKRTSGQATKMLTERDKGVPCPLMSPDTLVNLPRAPSPDAQTSQASTHMTPGKPHPGGHGVAAAGSRPQPAVRGRLQH